MEKLNPKTGALLLVDDNKADQKIIEEAFNTLGISNEIITANSGKEALEYLGSDDVQPILILCDIEMPGMNGLELRHEIFKDEKLRRKSIPFIFMSSNGSEKNVDLAYEYAVQGYFEKPKDFNGMVEMLRLIINYWKLCKHPNSKFYLIKELNQKK